MTDMSGIFQGLTKTSGEVGRHVLVTGGTGFVGHALVPALAAEGFRVTVLSRGDGLPAALQHAEVRSVRGLHEIPADDPVDTVINLAGARILGLPWTAARRQELLRSRVGLTQDLVAWMRSRSQRPRCLLSASAIGYYGVQPLGDDTPLTEDRPPQPVFMSQLCQQWEQAAAAALPLGVGVACLRFGLVMGHGGALPMLLLPVKLGLGGRLGSGRQWLSWVHIHDLLRALAHAWSALENEPADGLRAYNVTAPEAVRQADFSRTAAAVLHRPTSCRRQPGRCAGCWANRPTCCWRVSGWCRRGCSGRVSCSAIRACRPPCRIWRPAAPDRPPAGARQRPDPQSAAATRAAKPLNCGPCSAATS